MATFAGYLAGGVLGAIVATIAVFADASLRRRPRTARPPAREAPARAGLRQDRYDRCMRGDRRSRDRDRP
jgi:hypothetical protein